MFHTVLIKDEPCRLYVARIDQVDPYISGNKWFKLKNNLEIAIAEGHDTILTFGGAYSNHIYSASAAARRHDLKSIGIVRGEETLPLNHTLSFAKSNGMQLEYFSREKYRNKATNAVVDELKDKYGKFFLVPEGGSNEHAVKGVADVIEHLGSSFDYYITPVGTGGTLAGLVHGLKGKGNVLGISALKGMKGGIEKEIKELMIDKSYVNWNVNHDYHWKGYARMDDDLMKFIKQFKAEHEILLDPIYTSKAAFATLDLIRKGYFEKDSSILFLHTGGLQGWYGMKERYAFVSDSFPFDGA